MRPVPLVLMLGVLSVVAERAHAQSSDSSALAEQLFNEARELAKANHWTEACSKFEASLHYAPVLGTRLNLATCYEHIGKLASAWGLYRESVELAKKIGDLKRRDYAQKQAAALEPRLAKLAISAPVKSPAGFVVTRDGTAIAAGALGVALYVDPGAHEITASAPDFESFTRTITLVEGKTKTLAIPDLRAAPVSKPSADDHVAPVGAVSATRKHEAMRSQGTLTTRHKISIGVAGASVLSMFSGVVLGAIAKRRQSDAFKLCSDLATPCMQADQSNALLESSRGLALGANVAFGISAAAAIGAGVLWFKGAPNAESTTRVSVAPSLVSGKPSVIVMGRF